MTIEGVRRVVAVKVRHPGVADIIRRDFQVFIRELIQHQYNTTRILNPACSCMAVTINWGFLTAPHCIWKVLGQAFHIVEFHVML